ncbi:contractile injection system tape measure protein, partial [Aeromonas sp. SG16]|uniref:contractile injection system tape measure protein n=1 Tax=Aeromonas sp. SG16 TaxID=2950548 RepID=UPI00351E80AD
MHEGELLAVYHLAKLTLSLAVGHEQAEEVMERGSRLFYRELQGLLTSVLQRVMPEGLTLRLDTPLVVALGTLPAATFEAPFVSRLEGALEQVLRQHLTAQVGQGQWESREGSWQRLRQARRGGAAQLECWLRRQLLNGPSHWWPVLASYLLTGEGRSLGEQLQAETCRYLCQQLADLPVSAPLTRDSLWLSALRYFQRHPSQTLPGLPAEWRLTPSPRAGSHDQQLLPLLVTPAAALGEGGGAPELAHWLAHLCALPELRHYLAKQGGRGPASSALAGGHTGSQRPAAQGRQDEQPCPTVVGPMPMSTRIGHRAEQKDDLLQPGWLAVADDDRRSDAEPSAWEGEWLGGALSPSPAASLTGERWVGEGTSVYPADTAPAPRMAAQRGGALSTSPSLAGGRWAGEGGSAYPADAVPVPRMAALRGDALSASPSLAGERWAGEGGSAYPADVVSAPWMAAQRSGALSASPSLAGERWAGEGGSAYPADAVSAPWMAAQRGGALSASPSLAGERWAGEGGSAYPADVV